MSPPSESDWGRLHDTDGLHSQQITELAVAFADHRERVERRLKNGDARMQRIELALEENTKLTESVVAVAHNFEAVGRGVAWVAKRIKRAAVWITAVCAAVAAVYHLIVDIKWFK
jgi:hypothetical protein